MTVLTGRFTPSVAGGRTDASAVTFGADVSQEPVFLSATVVPARAFARLMLALGRVVRLKETGEQRDHSAYQAWVRGEYLKELPTALAAAAVRRPALMGKRNELFLESQRLWRRAAGFRPATDPWAAERRAFWNWLRTHNREAWFVLDPIVSVQPDATFFEAFSRDESVYARVRVPSGALASDEPSQIGTTNIDFSVALERELSRTRSYRPLHLTVGAKSVGVATDVSAALERKIDLPETWVRGLVEVQAALALAPVEVQMSSGALADVIARLESEREKQGPRALVFDLQPGEPVRVRIEPWGEVVTDTSSRFGGDGPRLIKVWGRRRLSVLADLLPHVDTVTLHLIDNGMPSFWTVSIDGISLTLGLSGWSSQDWAGRARFSAMIPASTAKPETVQKAVTLLQARGSLSNDELVTSLNLSPTEARSVLQRLCLAGQAMFDVEQSRYRWRALFPQLDLARGDDAELEERKGVELAQQGAVRIDTDELSPEGVRRLTSTVSSSARNSRVVLETDLDGRVTFAQCNCPHFRHHKLRQGPCRHIVATNIAEGAP